MTVGDVIYRKWRALLNKMGEPGEVAAAQQTAMYLRQLVAKGVVSRQALVPGLAFLVSHYRLTQKPQKLGELVRTITCDVNEGHSVIATVLAGQDVLSQAVWYFEHGSDQEWPEDDPLDAEVVL